MDETWLYHYDPETKQQSMEWWHSGSPRPPQKIPSTKFRWKSSRLDFWDQEGILLIDYLPKGQTINAEYYSSLFVQLKDILKDKHRGKFTKGVLLFHDIAPAHRVVATQKKLGFHPILRIWPRRTTTCSLDWKKQLKCRHFLSEAEVIAAAETWLDGQHSDFFWVACKS